MKLNTIDTIVRGTVITGALLSATSFYNAVNAYKDYAVSIQSGITQEERDNALDSKIEHYKWMVGTAVAGALLLGYGSRRYSIKQDLAQRRLPNVTPEMFNRSAGRPKDRGAPIPNFVLKEAGAYDAHGAPSSVQSSYRAASTTPAKTVPNGSAAPKASKTK